MTPPSAPLLEEATRALQQQYASQQNRTIEDLYGKAMLQLATRSSHHAQLLAYKTKVTNDIVRAVTVDQILQTMVTRGRTRWVGRGQFGETLLVQWQGVPVPMIMKLMGERQVAGCLPSTALTPPRFVCKDILPDSSTFEWAPPFKPEWEQSQYAILSSVSVDLAASPNLPFVFFAGYLELAEGRTMTLDGLIKNPRNHVANISKAKLPASSGAKVPQRRVSIVLMEYAGLNLDPLTNRLLHQAAMRPMATLVVRSVLCQVLHGLLTMRFVGMRHNDLHSNNVMGMPTPATHLLYVLEDVVEDGVHDVRVFRVPTLGMVWRIIDFGGSSLVDTAGERAAGTGRGAYRFSHGHMARFFYAGPTHPDVQDARVQDAPLETYDLFRLATTLIGTTQGGATPAEGLLRRMLLFAKALGRATAVRRAYTIPVRRVSAMQPPPIHLLQDARTTARVLKEVVDLSRASEDTGMLWELFHWLAEDSGFSVPTDRASQGVRPTDDGPYMLPRHQPVAHPTPAPKPTTQDVDRIVRAVRAMP